MSVESWAAAHRVANSPEKRLWLQQEAARRGEVIDELCGFLRSLNGPLTSSRETPPPLSEAEADFAVPVFAQREIDDGDAIRRSP